MPPTPQGKHRIRVRHGGRAWRSNHREYQDNEVLVCLDETQQATGAGDPYRSKSSPRTPAATHGATVTYNRVYQRNGVSNLFTECIATIWRDAAGGLHPDYVAHQDRLGGGSADILVTGRIVRTGG